MMVFEEHGSKALFPRALNWSIKWISSFLFSFVLAVFGLSIFSYSTFSFVFVFVAVQIFFWKMFHSSGLITVLLFDAAVIFSILMFRLYIILGPNI